MADGRDDLSVARFNRQGQLVQLSNALNHHTHITGYNSQGLPTGIRLPDGVSLQLNYDHNGHLQTLTRSAGNLSETTTFTFDRTSLLKQRRHPDGSWQRYHYNTARQRVRISNHWGEILELTPSQVSGAWSEQWIYNRHGQLEQHHQRQLDSLGRVFKLLSKNGDGTQLSYAPGGQLTSIHEQGNPHPTQHHYDSLGRLTLSIDALLGNTQIHYGLQGQISKVIDAEGSTTEYRYNGFGEVIWQRSDAQGELTLTRDAAGNVIAVANNSPNATQLHYDILNRLIHIDHTGKQQDVHYQYDQIDATHGSGIGRLTQMIDSSSTLDYQYDALGRLTTDRRTSKAEARTLHYQYNRLGQLQQLQYPNGAYLQYHYRQQRLDHIDYHRHTGQRTPLIQDINYAAFGTPQGWTYGNGLRYQRQMDLDGRTHHITIGTGTDKSDQLLWQQKYHYNTRKDINRIEHLTPRKQWNSRYEYDALHQLTQEITHNKRTRQKSKTVSVHNTYQYDRVGNRTNLNKSGIKTHYQYEPGNHLSAVGNARLGNTRIERDAGGNLLMLKNQDQFVYGPHNQVMAYFKNRKRQATYRYNAYRQRTEKRLPNAFHHYRYNHQGQLLEETRQSQNEDQPDTTSEHYLWLGQIPMARVTTDHNDQINVVYLHSDHLNTPRLATNQQQTIIWQWHSDAFGNGKANEDPDQDGVKTVINLRFTGQYYDQESGLHYNYHRYYDPTQGRYTQSDPIGLAGGINTYAYVGGNPLSRIDALGLYQVDIHYYMTFYLGVTAGLNVTDARNMALAAQYIDDNPETRPTEPGSDVFFSPLVNQEKLLKYHFTLWNMNGDNRLWNLNPNIDVNGSEQLGRLYSYAGISLLNKSCVMVTDQKIQFMGEYLHAFEDTFAHRDSKNVPYPANDGLGHTLGNENPDFTYNHKGCSPIGTDCKKWNVNEQRTLRMEERTYDEIRRFMNDTNYDNLRKGGKQTDPEKIEETLIKFNKIKEHGHLEEKAGKSKFEVTQKNSEKLKLLEKSLEDLGYRNEDGSVINLRDPNANEYMGYSVGIAGVRRLDNYRNIKNPEEFDGAILPAPVYGR